MSLFECESAKLYHFDLWFSNEQDVYKSLSKILSPQYYAPYQSPFIWNKDLTW